MATAEAVKVRKIQFYALEPKIAGSEAPLATSDSLNNLVEKALRPFELSSRRLVLYSAEDKAYSPYNDGQVRSQFQAQALEIASVYTKDIVNPNGTKVVGSEQVWKNLEEIVPSLVGLIVDPQNYTEGVAQSQSLDILRAAFQLARDPKTSVTWKVGIGGSDAPFTPARFLTYGIPTLKKAEAWNKFYQQREERVLVSAAVTKKIAQEEQQKGGDIGRERKGSIRQEVNGWVNQKGIQGLIEVGYLGDDEAEEVRQRYAIAQNPLNVQFIFTPEAALHVNFTGKEDLVRVGARRNATALKRFIDAFYPSIASQVGYLFDIPKDQYPPETRHYFDFFIQKVEGSTAPEMLRAKEKLGKMGRNHGSEDLPRSIWYAVMHRLAFADNGKLPVAPYIEYPDAQVKRAAEADIIITEGCRGEIVFNSVRRFMVQQGTEEAMTAFLQERIARGEVEYERTLEWLEEEIAAKQAEDVLSLNRPFRSKISIGLISRVAKQKAGYYTDRVDIDAADISLPTLEQTVQNIKGIKDSTEDKLRQDELASMQNDYQILLDEMRTRGTLVRAVV